MATERSKEGYCLFRVRRSLDLRAHRLGGRAAGAVRQHRSHGPAADLWRQTVCRYYPAAASRAGSPTAESFAADGVASAGAGCTPSIPSAIKKKA